MHTILEIIVFLVWLGIRAGFSSDVANAVLAILLTSYIGTTITKSGRDNKPWP